MSGIQAILKRDGRSTPILRDAVLLVAVGAVLGSPTAPAASRVIKSLLYGVGAQDPVAITDGTLILLAVAALSGIVAAHRATKVDLMIALRHE